MYRHSNKDACHFLFYIILLFCHVESTRSSSSSTFDLYGQESPFAVKSGNILEILSPENDAVLSNTTAIIDIKAEFNVGDSDSKKLCVALKNMKTNSIEASNCFHENFLTQVMFDHLDLGVTYQVKLSLHDDVKQHAVAIRSFTIGDIFGDTIENAIEKAMFFHRKLTIQYCQK